MPENVYQDLMDAGFRRSGRMVYQPVCRGCRACVPIRVPVARFRPGKSQRRCARRNADLHVTVARRPVPTDEKFALHRRYMSQWHGAREPESRGEFEAFLYESPVDTIEFTYRAGGATGPLLAVGICDVCPPRSLSSVYFWFDPAQARRGLGTYGALVEIERARAVGLEHYYLGYWVRACAAMSYKCAFRPYELLDTDGNWRESSPPS
jgi:arginine-tRNA-protein transferase